METTSAHEASAAAAHIHMPERGKPWLNVAKLAVAFGVLAVVIAHAEHEKILQHLIRMSPVWALLALVLFNLAQYFGAVRQRYYYCAIGYPMTMKFSIALYYVGMFYNLIFPGGIGGDAYKIYLLRKRAHMPVRDGIRLMFANRANGLYVLVMLMMLGIGYVGWDLGNPFFPVMLLLSLVVTSLGYFWGARLFWNEPSRMAAYALPYSVAVQGFTVLSVVVLWWALGNGGHMAEYVLLFLAASIIGVLPISVGGLGIREFVFFYGATLFNRLLGIELDAEFGVALSLMFFAVTLISSMVGLVWINRLPGMASAMARPQDAAAHVAA